MNMKVLVFILVLMMNIFTGCTNDKENVIHNKIQVAASFYTMAEFARAVGGDYVEVITLVPDGVEPHDWDPSPRDLTRLGHAQIFVYNGLLEPWAQQAMEALSERSIYAVQAGEGLYMRADKNDPHVWISPKRAITEVQRIKEALCTVDAKHADIYERNSAAYIEKLQALDKQLIMLGQNAPKKKFITAHAAFGHLADDYGLEQLAVSGLSPEAEPTPADLQRLINIVRKENVHYVFFETLSSPKIAQLLAGETGAKAAVLDPIEGLDEDGRKQNLNYLTIMQANIDALKKALYE